MEFIKKKVLRIMTTGTTTDCVPCHTIVPNLNVNYNFKISLTAESQDFGFFDAYENNYITGGIIPTQIPQTITGQSSSRLSELRKYTVTTVFVDQYVVNGTPTNDGVDLFNTIPNQKIVYYLGGIKFTDFVNSSGITTQTTFSFIGQSYNSPDFINVPYYKNPNKENIISNPKIYDDVFIIRQELSAFDKNYRLEFIGNLSELTTYAGGGFFNIVNNS